MSRYTRLLNADHDQTASSPAPGAGTGDGPGEDPEQQPRGKLSKMSTMFASLKESATAAGGNMREGMSRATDSVKTGLGIPSGEASRDGESDAQSEASSMMDEVADYCPKMTYQQRITGFAISFTCGYLMTFMSFRLFIKLVEGNPAPFVFLYTSGNILSLMSSVFLSGPQRQFKSMFDDKRKMTSICYMISLGSSIVVCFLPIPTGPRIGLLVLLLLVQMAASLWYTLSYIPYGRATARRFLMKFVSDE
mmetsp:Transcript_9026/g.20991  ORF Transcript_9026/g.20991 Transcript_9026/m.20991 type:complete len:250 (-) Transcript_9026:74-823(-)